MKKIITLTAATILAGTASHATNLTSLGVNAEGNTVWRITNSSSEPQEVELRRYGKGGSSKTYLVNPDERLVVEAGQPGTYIAEFEDGPKKTKASGPQVYTPTPTTGPKGDTGADGIDGVDGKDGADGKDVSYEQYMSDMATVAALGGLEMRTPYEGGFVWSLGVAGLNNEFGDAYALSGGIGYGISQNMSGYAKISVGDNSVSAFVGIEGRF